MSAAPAQSGRTRERLLQSAMELFTTQGYDATSLADVLQRAGVNSGSLYYFFKTLLYPIVMEPPFTREADPIERIFAVLADYRERLLYCDLEYECPIGKLALEVGRHSAPARAKIAENFAAWRAHIRQCLEDASERLPLNVHLDGLAIFVLTTMEGGLMQARTHHDISYYDASVSHLRSYFQYLLSEQSAPLKNQ